MSSSRRSKSGAVKPEPIQVEDYFHLITDPEANRVIDVSSGEDSEEPDPNAEVQYVARRYRPITKEIIDLSDSGHNPRTTLRPEVLARGSARRTYAREPSEVVELLSDEEESKAAEKRLKISDEMNSDEEYESWHAGYDLKNPANWIPCTQSECEGGPPLDVQYPMSFILPSKPQHVTNIPRRHGPDHPAASAIHLPWNILHTAVCPKWQTVRWEKHQLPARQRLSLEQSFGLHQLYKSSNLGNVNKTSGSVNKIIQGKNQIFACSAALGGGPDGPDESYNRENERGTLVVLQNGKIHHPEHGHEHTFNRGNRLLEYTKHYTVNDLVRNPLRPNILVSSGTDKAIRVWRITAEEPGLSFIRTIRYMHVPYEISFKPHSSTFISACSNGAIYIYPSLDDPSTTFELNVAPGQAGQAVGATAWGSNSTSNLLFASSEPVNGERGFHRAFDAHRKLPVLLFDAKESGDALAVDETGDHLALITQTDDNTHMFRIYDIRRKVSKAISNLILEPIRPGWSLFEPEEHHGEVNCLTYSPDNLYLAVARNDGATHVYDTRMLERGPLSRFKHKQKVKTNTHSYGVVHAKWLESHRSRLALVTGGDDGNIRIWDPLQSTENPNNGAIIAHSDWDVGYFSIGDGSKNEKALVIGDSGGHLTVYDSPQALGDLLNAAS